MTKPEKRIWFILNPNSGTGKPQELETMIHLGLPKSIHVEFRKTERAGHAVELTKEAVAAGADAVVAIGGDGTVNEIGGALVNTNTALGVLPSGSGNGFARHLGIPMKMVDAIECIRRFNVQIIDTASINGTPFMATAGLGFDAHVGWKFANFGKRGFLSYMKVTTLSFFSFKPKKYKLIIDGVERETEAFIINFANAGQYGNNAWIAPHASISDGKLDVCILKSFPALQVPGIVFKLFSKTLDQSKYYEVITAEEIRVIDPAIYHMDGEPSKADSDILIKVVPKSLKVIC